jgi:hypothetical protein
MIILHDANDEPSRGPLSSGSLSSEFQDRTFCSPIKTHPTPSSSSRQQQHQESNLIHNQQRFTKGKISERREHYSD